MKKLFFFLAAVAVTLTASAKVTTISPDADNDALRLAVYYAEDGDVIEMTEGTYVQCNNGYVAFDGKSVTVKAAEGANVVLQLQTPITIANGGKATLQGIKIDASRLTELADWYEHIIYPNDATEGKELVMEGCELYGFNLNKSAIYSAATNTLALCSINNCYFYDNMKSCFFFEGPSIGKLSITNSTFAHIATDASGYYAGIIDVRNADALVTIDHCTFFDCKVMNTDYAAITMKGPQTANVVISNNIFAFPEATDDQRAIRENVEAKNCLTFNYIKDNGGIHSSVTKTDCLLNIDPLFIDAANGNYGMFANSEAATASTTGGQIGDPRWKVSAAERRRIEITPTSPEAADNLRIALRNAEDGDTIVMAAGTYVESNSNYIAFDGKTVVVMAAEDAEVILQPQVRITIANGGKATFQNIKIDASKIHALADWYEHVFYVEDATEGKELVLDGCEFYGFDVNNSAIYAGADKKLDVCSLNNCYFYNNDKSCVFFDGESLGQLSITNSTFANITAKVTDKYYAGIIDVRSTAAKVTVDHCTFYNCLLMNTDYAAIMMKGPQKANVTISNNIFMLPEAIDGHRAIRQDVGAANCMTFNYVKDNGGIHSSVAQTSCFLNIDPLFVDAANNNFMLQANSPAIGKATDGSNLGDPRWGVAEPELITLTTGDNSAVIAANIDKTVNVKIERSFTANDGYYTLCVPFNMEPSVIGKAYSLGTITEHVSGEGININLVEEEYMLSAGVPYLVLPKANMSELVVENVTIQSDEASGQNIYSKELNVQIFFEGYYSAGGQTDGSTEYYVGEHGYLYNGVVAKRGLCGLFTITDKDGNPTKVRARVVTREEVETGIDNNQLPNTNIQKVLENGQLIIIRDCVKYNVQGQVIK